MLLSRRLFLTLTGSAVVAPSLLRGKEQVPSMLDHILLGCKDLQHGIDFVEQHTGVRAAFGGVHPGRGTQNALLSLGEKHYLEIIAPDPKQGGPVWRPSIANLTEPRLIGWAAHVSDIDEFASRLKVAQIPCEGPWPGSRQRPDGRVLRWKTLSLKNDEGGLLPFFIEWSADSSHPSIDAPQGGRLAGFELVAPDPDALARTVAQLSLDVTVRKGGRSQLIASLAGPKGELELSS